jgi:hypothetical protein
LVGGWFRYPEVVFINHVQSKILYLTCGRGGGGEKMNPAVVFIKIRC